MNKKLNRLACKQKKRKNHFARLSLLGLSVLVFTMPSFKAETLITTSSSIIRTSDGLPIICEDYNIEDILLPRYLYILKNKEGAESRFNLYFKNAILTNSTNYRVYLDSQYGSTLPGRWLYKSSLVDSTTSEFPLTLSVKSGSDALSVTSKTTTVELVDTEDTTPVRLLAIGDSLTRAGVYLTEVKSSLKNVETVGTRLYTGEHNAREGRGGWTFDKYFTSINSEDLDSPFVFPVGVFGNQYKGNTRDWKNICYDNPKYYLYDGFQQIARGWKTEGEYLYDENGYYKYPELGDTMVDPSLPEGQQWVEWNGTSWVTKSIQPTEFEFNFSKYMSRFADAFPTGAPTHVSILLGANDFGTQDGFFNVESFIKYYQTAIESIHDYDPSIKVIVCLPTLGPNENMITDYDYRYKRYDRNSKLAVYYLLKAFDNDENLAKNVYLAPMTLNLDSTNGFDYKQVEQVLNEMPTLITTPTNGIHPNNTVGQLQMGEALAAVIQKTR